MCLSLRISHSLSIFTLFSMSCTLAAQMMSCLLLTGMTSMFEILTSVVSGWLPKILHYINICLKMSLNVTALLFL